MIIENGTIEEINKSASGRDPDTGYPIEPTVSYGKPIPCQWVINNQNKLAKTNGEHFTSCSYTIFIECRPFKAEQIRLKDLGGTIIGEYSIISLEPLDAVNEIRIIV